MKELKELLKSGLTIEAVAARLQVSSRSVERWRDGLNSPHPRCYRLIHKMYERMVERQAEGRLDHE